MSLPDEPDHIADAPHPLDLPLPLNMTYSPCMECGGKGYVPVINIDLETGRERHDEACCPNCHGECVVLAYY